MKKLEEPDPFPRNENVPCFKLKEYLTRRNMSFEEKITGRTTTIIIKRQQIPL